MAVKWAVANANWNLGTTWNDGVVPTADDDVYCNNYNIAITTNVVAKSITNLGNADYGINAGGRIQIGAANLTLNADLVCGAVSLLQRTAAINNITINGNITPSMSAVSLCSSAFNNNTSLTLNGNILGAGTLGHVFSWGFGVGAYTFNGNITCGNGIISNSHTTLTINGSVTGGSNQYAFATCTSLSLSGTFVGNGKELTLGVNGNATFNSSITQKANSNTPIVPYIQGIATISGDIGYSGLNLGIAAMSYNITTDIRWYCVDDTPQLPIEIVKREARIFPQESEVKQGVNYGTFDTPYVGTYAPDFPQEANVLQGVTYDNGNKTGTLAPVVLGDYPDVDKVLVGTIFDYGNKVGTLEPTADYPAEADVLQGVEYAYGQMTGTLSVSTDYPQEANVLQGVEYAYGSMVGTLEVVQMQADYPSEDDVRFDVVFDFGNKQGKCHVPIPEDVREGVPVDVNEVGTLIPSSGGDRLRIADFGYYTNAQSDTYIVDITDADKPKFASAEERILIEMFPSLDLDNIPEMYFDDLFVKYLKYRLIVEYYRTAGVNSTFTPSEPTTEIVNYRNVTCEVWLNSANIYLNAWNKKYDLNKPPQKIRL